MDQYVNKSEAVARIGGNEKLYKTLIKSYLKNPAWEQLKQQVAENNIEEAAKTAHSIKGMAANLSFPLVYSTVMALEISLKGGSCTESEYEDFNSAMEKTNAILNDMVAEG